MNPLLKILRGAEWWSYKIPPILAIAYAMILVKGSDPRSNLVRMLAGIVSIIAVAAYGYVINDCFDIEVDRKAGKFNGMARRSVPQRAAILLFILAIGWIPAYLADYPLWACLFLSLDFFLPTIYSIPPIRLKERGVLGVLSDASAAHLLPTLFFAALLLGQGPEPNARGVALMVIAAIWYSLVGLRGILNHQILDREGDIAAGVETFVTSKGQLASLLVTRGVLYSVEMFFLILVILLFRPISSFVFPVFVGYLAFELAKRLLYWDESFVVGHSVDQSLRRYLPFANNVFYNLWLPSVLSLELAWKYPDLWFVPVIHLCLFGTRWRHEHREPIGVLRELGRKAYRAWVPLRTGWSVEGSPSLWPRLRRDFSQIRVLPRSTSAQSSDVKILSGRIPIAEGVAYRLIFRAKSNQPRRLTIGVGQRFSPFLELGLTREVIVDAQRRTMVFDMIATQSDRNGCIFIWLGQSDTPFDLELVRLECVSDPWYLSTFNGVSAERVVPEDTRFDVRVERLDSSAKPWDVLLRFPMGTIHPQSSLCQVRVLMRSESDRMVTFGLVDSTDHTSLVGMGHDVIVTEIEQEFVALVPIDRRRPVDVFFWLGGASEWVEIGRPCLEWLSEDRFWHVDSSTPGSLRRLPSSEGASFRVETSTDLSSPSHAVWQRIDSRSMNGARIQFFARKSGDIATVSVGVLKITREGTSTVAECEARIHGGVEVLTIDTAIDEPQAEYRVYVWFPNTLMDVALGPLSLTPISVNQVWHLRTESQEWVTRSFGDPRSVVLDVHPSGTEPWGVRLTSDRLPSSETSRQISFRVRSSCACVIPVGVCEQSEPWRPIGGMIQALLHDEWSPVIWDIPPTDREGSITLMLGEVSGTVEVADRSVRPHEGVAWRLESNPPAIALRTEAQTPEAQGRIDVRTAGEKKEDVKIVSSLGPVVEGQLIHVELPLRADEKREALIGIQESQAPWRSLGDWRIVSIDSDFRSYAVELTVLRSGNDARVMFSFGQMIGAIEWGPSALQIRDSDRPAWQLTQSTGGIAYTTSGSRADALKVEFLSTSASAFDVKLVLPVGAVRAGSWYRVRVELRATEPREVTLGCFQNTSPWSSLGWVCERSVGSSWLEFEADFRADADDDSPVLMVACGQSTIAVEAGDASIDEIDPRKRIDIVSPEHAVVRTIRFFADREYCRFEPIQFLPTWDAKVLWRHFSLEEGKCYRLHAILRSDDVRPMTMAVGQSGAPWQTTGPVESCELSPVMTSVVIDFMARSSDASSSLWFCIGGSTVPVDVASAGVYEIAPERYWCVAVGGKHVIRSITDEDASVDRFTISVPSPDPWSLKIVGLSRPIARGRLYRLTCRVRSNRALPVSFCFVQQHAPWARLGNLQSITVETEWRDLEIDLEATEEDEAIAPTIFWGGEEGTLEVSGLCWSVRDPATLRSPVSFGSWVDPLGDVKKNREADDEIERQGDGQ